MKHPLCNFLIRDSVTDAELKYLNMVCYKVIAGNGEIEFNTPDEYEHLKNGFNIPQCTGVRGVTAENLDLAIERILDTFENMMDSGMLEYSCDGLVVAIIIIMTSTVLVNQVTPENIALKMGKYWSKHLFIYY